MASTNVAPDGTRIHVHEQVPSGKPWASLLLVHGIAEHCGRYERTMTLLADAGIRVHAFDLRGHGRSGGARADVRRWTDHLDDVARLLAGLRAEEPGLPTVLMAHSMGGLIALEAALSGRAAPDLLVLSAPGIEDALPRWQHVVAPIGARVAPSLPITNAWPPEALSRDPEVGRRAADDPLCLPRTTLRLGAHAFAAQERVRAALPRLSVPTLVLHGGDDPIVPVADTERLGTLPDVTRRVYPGLRHEILNEPEGPAIVADIVAWLRVAAGSTDPPQDETAGSRGQVGFPKTPQP